VKIRRTVIATAAAVALFLPIAACSSDSSSNSTTSTTASSGDQITDTACPFTGTLETSTGGLCAVDQRGGWSQRIALGRLRSFGEEAVSGQRFTNSCVHLTRYRLILSFVTDVSANGDCEYRRAHDSVDSNCSAQQRWMKASAIVRTKPSASEGEGSHHRDDPPLHWSPNREDHYRDNVDGKLQHAFECIEPLEMVDHRDAEHR
jgi:hypothetical protein